MLLSEVRRFFWWKTTLGLIWINRRNGTCVREEVGQGNLRVRTLLNNMGQESSLGVRDGYQPVGHSLWEWKLETVGIQMPNIWFPLHWLPIVTLVIALPWRMEVQLRVCLGKSRTERNGVLIMKWPEATEKNLGVGLWGESWHATRGQLSSPQPTQIWVLPGLCEEDWGLDAQYECGRLKMATNSLSLPTSTSGGSFPQSWHRPGPGTL